MGLTYADAEQRLATSGFKADRGETRFNNAPRGTVIEQDPQAEETATRGIRVRLVVSAGQRMGAVPAVIGLSREQAMTLLAESGFEPGDVTERASNEPRGAIIDSRPRPGAQAPMPSLVALVMSAGPTTIVVPDLVGRPLSDATQLLRQVGLAVGGIRVPVGGAPDQGGIIQAQSPAAGSLVVAGTRVEITLGGRP